MNSDRNKMVSHTTIYLYGTILRHSVSVIMLPIYTRYLTPEDYGVVELLSMLIDIATIIFGARVAEAVFRYYCTAANEIDKKKIIVSALFLGGVLNGIGYVVILSASDYLSTLMFSDVDYSNGIALFALTMFMMPLSEVPLTYIRAEQKPWTYLLFSILKLNLHHGG